MFAKLLLALSLAAAAQAISLMPAASLSCSNGLFCAMGETCMSNKQGAGAKLACSPLPNAVICNDRRHSCPSGSTCFNELCMPANAGQPFKASMSKDAVSVGLRTYGQGINIHPNDVTVAVPAATRGVVTLSGIKFGPATRGSATGISVSTSRDAASYGFPSGALGQCVEFTSLTMATNEAGSTASPVLTFTLSTTVPAGGTITLNMPVGYFIGTASIHSGSAGVIMMGYATVTSTQIVITITMGSIGIESDITVTLSGMTLGAAQNSGTFSLSTSSEPMSCQSLVAPAIVATSTGPRVFGVGFSIAGPDRVPGATGKSVTFTFVTSTFLAAGDAITLNYPSGFFVTGQPPAVRSSSGAFSAIFGGSSSVVLTTSIALPVGFYIVTLSGITFGPATRGSATGISVSTSRDAASLGYPSGALGQCVEFTSLTMATNEAGSTASPVLTFTLSTTVPAGYGTITLNMPVGYFTGTASIPTGSASVPVLSGSANVATATSTQIVIKIDSGNIGIESVTVTLSGLTLGAAQNSGTFSLSTSSEPMSCQSLVAPAIVATSTGPRVFGVGFSIAGPDRVPGATGKSVTFTFTTASALSPGDAITLNYPSGFIENSFPPVLLSSIGALILTFQGSSSVILTISAPSPVRVHGDNFCNAATSDLANVCQCHSNQNGSSVMCQANVGNFINTIVGIAVGPTIPGIAYCIGTGTLPETIDYSSGTAMPNLPGLVCGIIGGPSTQSIPIAGAGLEFLGTGVATTADFSVNTDNSAISLDISVGVCTAGTGGATCSDQPAAQNPLSGIISGARSPRPILQFIPPCHQP